MVEPNSIALLYANKRVWIPFGWFANAMPATASSGWAVMVYKCYNPFILGGGNMSDACAKVGIE